MKTTATIASVKTSHQPATYNGPGKTTLSITLDIALPTPTAPLSINDWARQLPYHEQQAIRKAQEQRAAKAAGRKPLGHLTKKQKQSQEDAHANGEECAWALTCENCNPVAGASEGDDLACLEHREPACEDCETANAPFLDEASLTNLHARHELYLTDVRTVNRQAVQAAQEAALFLLLIKQAVRLSVEPLQAAMAGLLLLEGSEPTP